jgi:ABC-type bacteriocin/lantibiotic exporter with double-glycine peptidase domain
LTKIGVPETEASVMDQLGTAMVSLAGLEQVFINNGCKTQALKVDPAYFKKHPVTAILHYTEGHFVVFIYKKRTICLCFLTLLMDKYIS